ncbi:MAG: hypothetical protein K8I27_05880 [Planctomycetes bacterium]|nr:hypothetical protein [Planctomycetota bacterium]
MRRFLLCLAPILLVCVNAGAEPKEERKVNCVYPGEVFQNALGDFATQLGYTLELGEYEDTWELEQPIWVHAKGVPATRAAEMISASGGLRVDLSATARTISLSEFDDDRLPATEVRSFKVEKLVREFLGYQKRYGRVRVGEEAPDLTYRPSGTEELRDAVEEILRLTETGGGGSALGMRLVYSRDATDIAKIAELLKLLEAPGESEALRQDRDNRAHMQSLRSEFAGADQLVSAVLWQLFKDARIPVYIDHSVIEALDFEYDTTRVPLRKDRTHYDALVELAREQEFSVDSVNGALRLHSLDWMGSASYRVYDVSGLLAELETEYAALKTDGSLEEGYRGDLRTEGGVEVVVNALEQQLDNAGHAPLIRAYGSRIVVVGGIDIVDRAGSILTALGWNEGKEPK